MKSTDNQGHFKTIES